MAAAIVCMPLPLRSATTTAGSWVTFPPPRPDGATRLLARGSGFLEIALQCGGGPWRLYIDRTDPNDDVAHEFEDFRLEYTIGRGGGSVDGEAQFGYSFQSLQANSFVKTLIDQDGTLEFPLKPDGKIYKIKLIGNRKAIEPYLKNCPID